MASKQALAIQSDAACDRIEARIAELTGGGVTPLPRLHRDLYELQRDQLAIIADWLDNIQLDDGLEKARALIRSGNWTKAEMEALLLGGE